MTKLILQATKILIALITALLIFSCNSFNGIKGNGTVTIETRETSKFEGVKAKTGLNVTLEQGPNFLVEVEADENLQEHIFAEVKDGILSVYSDVNIYSAEAKKVTIQAPHFNTIHASSGASIHSASTIIASDLDVDTSSGSSINISVKAKNLNCESSSGSSLTLKGEAEKAYLDSSSGSSMHLKDLAVNYVTAESSSGSSIETDVLEKLSGKASSGSSIHTVSTPKEVEKVESSGGSVSID